MNPADDLKLPASIKLLLWIGGILGAIALPLAIELIRDSNIFQVLKESKPIDSLINTEISVGISIESILVSLIVLSLSLNFFLYKRMDIYYRASMQIGEYFIKVSESYAKLTGKPVTIKFKDNDFVIDAKSEIPDSNKKL